MEAALPPWVPWRERHPVAGYQQAIWHREQAIRVERVRALEPAGRPGWVIGGW
jgi:hypothetical protein